LDQYKPKLNSPDSAYHRLTDTTFYQNLVSSFRH